MATTGPALRYERVAYLNTGTLLSPTWSLIGEGFETLDDELNPEVDEVTYISDASATKTITAYAPEWNFDATVIKDDTVVTYLRNIGAELSTGADAETEVVMFDLWNVAIDGTVDAKKFSVAVQIDSIASGAGGEKLQMSGALLSKGDPVDGSFDTDTLVFTADVIS